MPTNNKIVVCSRSHRCKGKATMPSLCVVEMHVTVEDADIFDVAQKSFYCAYKYKSIYVFFQIPRYFCDILTTLSLSRRITYDPNGNLHVNLSKWDRR
jgi:hypothetical protein